MDNLFNWLIANRTVITLVLFIAAVILVWRVPGIMHPQWRRAAMNLLKRRWQVWRNPNDANVHYLLGDQLYLFDRYAEAESEIREAIRIDPQHKDALTVLGVILTKNESRVNEAEEIYKQILEIDPNHIYALNNLANSAFRAERYAEAEVLARKAIATDPKFAPAYYVLGYALQWLDRYDEAETVLKTAILLAPTDKQAFEFLGNRAYHRKEYTEAEQHYRHVIELDPTNQEFLQYLVQVLRFQQKNQDALFYLKQLYDLAPKDLDTVFALAAVHKKLGNKSEFAELAIKAESMISPESWYNLACFECICDRSELAFEHLARAAKQADFDRAWAWRDPDLADIRNDPRFEQIVGARPE